MQNLYYLFLCLTYLVPRNSERLKLDRSLYINVGNYEENIHRFSKDDSNYWRNCVIFIGEIYVLLYI